MIVGWLADNVETLGGAEYDSAALQAASPWKVVPMRPGQVGPADLYVVANCVSYEPSDLPRGRIVKIVNDSWIYGSSVLRTALLRHADLVVFRSPLHRDRFLFPVAARIELLPSPVNLAAFRRATHRTQRQPRAVWVAHVLSEQRAAGLRAATRWAESRGVPLDAYGANTHGGPVSYRTLPKLLAGYEWFAHANGSFEPFGRSTVEAWAAGCKLAVAETTGALWWIEHDPAALEDPAARFWKLLADLVEEEVAA